jgi:uncharacterized protein
VSLRPSPANDGQIHVGNERVNDLRDAAPAPAAHDASQPATWLALALALGGLPLIAFVAGELSSATPTVIGAEMAVIALIASIGAITVFGERRSLRSFGLRRVDGTSVLYGLGLAAFFVFVYGPGAMYFMARVSPEGLREGLARLARLPWWLQCVAIVLNGIAEEVLYRGYAFTRLSEITGSRWMAGAIVVFGAAAAHLVWWDWALTLTAVVSGALLTAFFAWRRDLLALIIAHVVADAVGLLGS